ncbi:hypothetical protein CLV92_104263 [Kineococcus xinjiangensis]|uniref:Uncharacterized protein n=1 Tax=Kineococcus xinjiangensis TaxID=512762 RepID=A0A2S6IT63_9ACTN|nr:hypothetical protein [Kineococcus xinjiangensis]PPK97442.1 hypothetical protein CLV92_104263 [Kineococcus xinjiangensis]
MSTQPEDAQPQQAQDDRPGSAGAAEEPTADGYGNDTGFADEAEQADTQD